MSFFTKNISSSVTIIVIYYIVLPLISALQKKYDDYDDCIFNIFIIVIFFGINLYVPVSLGGLKGQDVIYHDYESKQEYKYTYYGNYENSYQFTSGKKVILIPNDKGYITYVNTNILSKIFK